MTRKTDRLVTVLGGGGFIGRYVVQALFAAGQRVRIAQRDPLRAYFLKPLAPVGQIQFAAAEITRPEQVERAIAGSDAVINLVGILAGDFDEVHRDGARNVAEAARSAGAETLVHMSALGADPESESNYGRSKGEGEIAVREAYPEAAIFRPSVAFGAEDHFVNKFAMMAQTLPVIPVIRPKWRLQPVHAADLGRAIARAALDPARYQGRTYELGGPHVMTMRELNDWILDRIGRSSKPVFEIPDAVAGPLAGLIGWLPGAPITRDQWMMMQKDNVVEGGGTGFDEFGFPPAPLPAIAEGWLTQYRRSGRFAAKSPY
jgi:NADH dehydrogenase